MEAGERALRASPTALSPNDGVHKVREAPLGRVGTAAPPTSFHSRHLRHRHTTRRSTIRHTHLLEHTSVNWKSGSMGGSHLWQKTWNAAPVNKAVRPPDVDCRKLSRTSLRTVAPRWRQIGLGESLGTSGLRDIEARGPRPMFLVYSIYEHEDEGNMKRRTHLVVTIL